MKRNNNSITVLSSDVAREKEMQKVQEMIIGGRGKKDVNYYCEGYQRQGEKPKILEEPSYYCEYKWNME